MAEPSPDAAWKRADVSRVYTVVAFTTDLVHKTKGANTGLWTMDNPIVLKGDMASEKPWQFVANVPPEFSDVAESITFGWDWDTTSAGAYLPNRGPERFGYVVRDPAAAPRGRVVITVVFRTAMDEAAATKAIMPIYNRAVGM